MAAENLIGIRITADAAGLQSTLQSASRDMEQFGNKVKETGDAIGKTITPRLNEMGLTVGQMSNAMRNLPAQFSDIVVSLQGGQKPLTVLLQQGGQLKDMFGGVGNAAKAMGTYVVGLISPFSVAAAAVGAIGVAYYQGAQEAHEFNKSLILTGNMAGTTAAQLQNMAVAVGKSTGGTIGAAAEALAAFAGSGSIAVGQFERLSAAAINFERVTGTAVADTVKQFAELGKDPLTASIKLNESTHFLTMSVYEQIKALTDQGKVLEAGVVAQNAWANVMEQRAPKMVENLGLAERAWKAAGAEAAKAWDKFKGIGRDTDPVADVKSALVSAQERLAQQTKDRDGSTGYERMGRDRDVAKQEAVVTALKEQVGYTQEIDRLSGRAAEAAARNAKALDAQVAFDKEHEKYLGNDLKLKREIAAEDAMYAKVSHNAANDKKHLETLAGIRDKYKDPAQARGTEGNAFAGDQAAAKSWAKFYQEFIDLGAQAEAKTLDLNKAQEKLVEYLKSPAYQKMSEPARQLALSAAYAAVSQEQLRDELAATAKEAELAQKAYDGMVQAQERSASSTEEKLRKQLEQNSTIGMTTEALGEQEAATLRLHAAELDRKADLQEIIWADGKLAEASRAEAQALRELADATVTGAQLKASGEAAKKATEEWKRASQQIEQSLTDALMRGFENGKGFAENFRDTVANMFKTLVLRPIVQAVVAPVAALLTPGAAQAGAAGGAEGVLGQAAGLKGVYDSWNASLGTFASSISTVSATMGKWMIENTTGILQKAGVQLYSKAGSIGAGATVAVGALAGYGIGKSISGQHSVFGDGKGDTAVIAGTAIGAALGSIVPVLGTAIGAVIGGTLGGVFNRAFGQGAKEINASGIEGAFSGNSFNGQSYKEWSRAGGWFSKGSNGTDYEALDGTMASGLGKAYAAVTAQTAAMANALGLPTAQILGYTKSIRLDAAQLNEAGITSLFEGIGDELARTVVSPEFIREGERASIALARMVTGLATVNTAFEVLDKTILATSLSGGDAASKLVDLFGGVDKFNAATLEYYQAFYSEAERNAKTTQHLASSFATLGLAVPDTLEAYRDLVDAQDITTASGRETFAALMSLSSAFAQVNASAAEAAKSLLKSFNFTSYADYAAANASAGQTLVPRFANGGYHTGGLRIVGENSPELELTGASRILNDSQVADVLRGGSGSDAMVAELQALRAEQRAQALSIASLTSRMVKILDQWDVDGMPAVMTA